MIARSDGIYCKAKWAARPTRSAPPPHPKTPNKPNRPAPPSQTVSRNTNHETRAKASYELQKNISPFLHNDLPAHHPHKHPKNLTPHATFQARPVRIVHRINPPRLAKSVRGCSCGEDSLRGNDSKSRADTRMTPRGVAVKQMCGSTASAPSDEATSHPLNLHPPRLLR